MKANTLSRKVMCWLVVSILLLDTPAWCGQAQDKLAPKHDISVASFLQATWYLWLKEQIPRFSNSTYAISSGGQHTSVPNIIEANLLFCLRQNIRSVLSSGNEQKLNYVIAAGVTSELDLLVKKLLEAFRAEGQSILNWKINVIVLNIEEHDLEMTSAFWDSVIKPGIGLAADRFDFALLKLDLTNAIQVNHFVKMVEKVNIHGIFMLLVGMKTLVNSSFLYSLMQSYDRSCWLITDVHTIKEDFASLVDRFFMIRPTFYNSGGPRIYSPMTNINTLLGINITESASSTLSQARTDVKSFAFNVYFSNGSTATVSGIIENGYRIYFDEIAFSENLSNTFQSFLELVIIRETLGVLYQHFSETNGRFFPARKLTMIVTLRLSKKIQCASGLSEVSQSLDMNFTEDSHYISFPSFDAHVLDNLISNMYIVAASSAAPSPDSALTAVDHRTMRNPLLQKEIENENIFRVDQYGLVRKEVYRGDYSGEALLTDAPDVIDTEAVRKIQHTRKAVLPRMDLRTQAPHVAAFLEYHGITEERMKTLAASLDLLVKKGAVTVGGTFAHARRGVTNKDDTCVWLGEKAISELTEEELAVLIMEEAMHILRPDAQHGTAAGEVQHSKKIKKKLEKLAEKNGEPVPDTICEADTDVDPIPLKPVISSFSMQLCGQAIASNNSDLIPEEYLRMLLTRPLYNGQYRDLRTHLFLSDKEQVFQIWEAKVQLFELLHSFKEAERAKLVERLNMMARTLDSETENGEHCKALKEITEAYWEIRTRTMSKNEIRMIIKYKRLHNIARYKTFFGYKNTEDKAALLEKIIAKLMSDPSETPIMVFRVPSFYYEFKRGENPYFFPDHKIPGTFIRVLALPKIPVILPEGYLDELRSLLGGTNTFRAKSVTEILRQYIFGNIGALDIRFVDIESTLKVNCDPEILELLAMLKNIQTQMKSESLIPQANGTRFEQKQELQLDTSV